LDFLPCQASSVACKCLFFAGGKIATKQYAQLGSEQFKELQLIKFAWKSRIDNLASYNSEQVEEIDGGMREY